ncbi:hypothetical protein [Halorarius halobius]|uniref:hypothetical protein n=1 Tax=Halorarius halobius TaxID=2962671 RepID=UPI0020CE4617|nr:hypothetical protein [Halorarius halobius]
MTSRSPALPYAAIAVLVLLNGVVRGVRQYLPILLTDDGFGPGALTGVLLGMDVVQALFVPVGAVVLGYGFAETLDVENRLGVTAAVTYLLAVVGYLVGFGAVLLLVPEASSTGSLLRNLAAAAVVGLTNGLSATVAVVAGAAVGRLR